MQRFQRTSNFIWHWALHETSNPFAQNLQELIRCKDEVLLELSAGLVCLLFQHPLAGLREEEVLRLSTVRNAYNCQPYFYACHIHQVMNVPELVSMLLFLVESTNLKILSRG